MFDDFQMEHSSQVINLHGEKDKNSCRRARDGDNRYTSYRSGDIDNILHVMMYVWGISYIPHTGQVIYI